MDLGRYGSDGVELEAYRIMKLRRNSGALAGGCCVGEYELQDSARTFLTVWFPFDLQPAENRCSCGKHPTPTTRTTCDHDTTSPHRHRPFVDSPRSHILPKSPPPPHRRVDDHVTCQLLRRLHRPLAPGFLFRSGHSAVVAFGLGACCLWPMRTFGRGV